MLVLGRKVGERIVLPTMNVTIEVVRISRGRVRLGVTAPDAVPVHRSETWRRIRDSGPSPSTGNGNGAKPVRVLIADHDESLRRRYQRVLFQVGFDVETVSGGVDCIARLRECPPDVLVLEAELPWGGSSGVLALMGEESDVPRVPVLMHGSGRSLSDRDHPSSPVARHATRPLAPVDLAIMVRELAMRSRRKGPLQRSLAREADLHAHLARWIARRTGGRLSSLRVETLPDRVIVHGCTRSYYARQLAETAVSEVFNTLRFGPRKSVDFDIQVVPDGEELACP